MIFWRGLSKERRLGGRATDPKRKGDRDDIKRILEAAAVAEAEGDADKMRKASYKLFRLDLYERAWELRIRSAGFKQQSPISEWEGNDLAGRSILIRASTSKSHRRGAAVNSVYCSCGTARPLLHRACRTATGPLL
jgi:hypothetical protein